MGDIGTLSFIWHGNFYKQINLSIDIVPAIIIKDWKPENARSVDPTGGAVPKETFLILRAFIEKFEYDLEIHGELNAVSETTGMEPANLEILNGKGWDSGSDCTSDKSDEESDKEPVNSTSFFYNTFVVRDMRDNIGYQIPTIKRLLRRGAAFLNELIRQPEPAKNKKTADDDFAILHPCKQPRKSNTNVDSEAQDMTGEENKYVDVRKQRSPKASFDSNMPSTSTEYETCKRVASYQDNLYGSTNKSDMDKKKNEGIHESFDNPEDTDACNINILKEFDSSGTDDVEGDKDECTFTENRNDDSEETFDEEFIRNVLMKSVGSDKSEFDALDGILDTQHHYSFSELIGNDDDSNEDNTDYDDLDDDPPREDMGFKISFSKWENETMASLPSCIKIAYMLSKILVSYVPRIRNPLNRGVSKIKGYSSVNDLFSYLLKMALFHAIQKHRDRLTIKPTVGEQVDQNQEKTSGSDFSCDGQIIYSRTGGRCAPEMGQSTMHAFSSKEIHDVAFWVDSLFSEIETSAETGYLGAYFDEKFNILDRISTSGKQKNNPYPALFYLRKHCKMIRALVRVEEKTTNESTIKAWNIK